MESRFWLLDWDRSDHFEALANAVDAGRLVAVVDEEAGGIIAYALGEQHAKEISKALNAAAHGITAIMERADRAKADDEPSEFYDGLLLAADILADTLAP